MWYRTYFNDYYIKIYQPLLTPELNLMEVSFYEDVLSLSEGDLILDIPCGFGRHSILLANKNYNIIGLDNNSNFIDIANSNSINLDNIKFINADMKEIEYKNQFDAIINTFTSFGYFSDDENFKLLKKLSKALKKGGRLLLDNINREWILNNSDENGDDWYLYPDNMVLLSKNYFNILTGRWISKQNIIKNGNVVNQYQDIRVYTYTEIEKLLNTVGMKIISVYGDCNKSLYSKNSMNMIIIAEKVSNKSIF